MQYSAELRQEVHLSLSGARGSGKRTILDRVCPSRMFSDMIFRGCAAGADVVAYLGNPLDVQRRIGGGLDGVVYVIDATDRAGAKEVITEVKGVAADKKLGRARILFFANKQDLPSAMSGEELRELLMAEIGDTVLVEWRIEPCSALTGEGLEAGMKWVTEKAEADKLFDFFTKDVASRKLKDMLGRTVPPEQRMGHEMHNWLSSPVPFVRLSCPDSAAIDGARWTMRVVGPPDTPFEGASYRFDVEFPTMYPESAPLLVCRTKNGVIPCGAVLLPCLSQWTPKCSLATIASEVMALLLSPGGNEREVRELAKEAAAGGGTQPTEAGRGGVRESGEPTQWTHAERRITHTFRIKIQAQVKHLAAFAAGGESTPSSSPESGKGEEQGTSCALVDFDMAETLDCDVAQFSRYWEGRRREETCVVAKMVRFPKCFSLVREGWGATLTVHRAMILAKCEPEAAGGAVLRVRSDSASVARRTVELLAAMA